LVPVAAAPSGRVRRPDPLPDAQLVALDPGFHCVRMQWIRGFMAFQLVRRTWSVMLMVPA
jgi:hypothetical protein